MGAWILKANQFPAVLIQAGFLTSQKDLAYLSQIENQKTIARNILKGIENYAAQNGLSKDNVSVTTDTIPEMYYQNKKVTGLSVQSKVSTVQVTYADGSTETISKKEADKRGFVLPPPPPPPAPPGQSTPLLRPAPPAPPKLTENTSEDDANAGNDTTILIADKFIIGDGYQGDGRLKNQMILLDGKEISKEEMNRLPSGSIATLTMIEGKK